MEKTIITTGKTVDLTIEAALAQLGLDRDSVSVQVISREKSGFLGIGNQPAKVEVTYEAPNPAPEAPRVVLSSASRSKPKAKPVVAQPAPAPVAPKAEPKPVVKAERKPVVKAERKPEPKVEAPKAPTEPKVYAPAEAGSVEEKIEKFLKGLLEHMGSDAVPHAWKEEGTTYKVEFEGSDLGYLIGRRGDTLDALQHLANYSVGRTVEGHIRINVDAEDYRAKREDSLSRYARKKAQ